MVEGMLSGDSMESQGPLTLPEVLVSMVLPGIKMSQTNQESVMVEGMPS